MSSDSGAWIPSRQLPTHHTTPVSRLPHHIQNIRYGGASVVMRFCGMVWLYIYTLKVYLYLLMQISSGSFS